MKSEQAIEAMRQGKKVRCTSWGKGEFIYVNNDGIILDEVEREYCPFASIHFNKKWELYEEPKQEKIENLTFGEALELLKHNAQKISRACWKNPSVYVSIECNPIDENHPKELRVKNIQGYYVPWTPNNAELFVDDWYVVE